MQRSTIQVRAQRALILAAGFRLQYRVLRCTKACFAEVYVCGSGEAETLRFSSACAGFVPFIGSFRDMDAAAVPRINALCRQLSIDYVLPSCADTTRFLAAYGSGLEVPHYPVPSEQVFDTLDNKWNFARLCEELGVPVPTTTCFATFPEVVEAASSGRLTYPTILKPLSMWGSVGVMKIAGPVEMPRALDYQPILVQDYVPGEDFCAFFLCRKGRIIASFSYTKALHSITTDSDPEVSRYAGIIVEHLGYDGIIGFDLRRSSDGTFAFVECNPRFWYRMDLALMIGLNVVELGYMDHLGTMPEPEVRSGLTLQLPSGLLRTAFVPWSLNRYDIAHLKYLAGDALLNTWTAVSSLLGVNRSAPDTTPVGTVRNASVQPTPPAMHSTGAYQNL